MLLLSQPQLGNLSSPPTIGSWPNEPNGFHHQNILTAAFTQVRTATQWHKPKTSMIQLANKQLHLVLSIPQVPYPHELLLKFYNLNNSVTIYDVPKPNILPTLIQSSTWRQVVNKRMTTLAQSSLQANSQFVSFIILQFIYIDVFRINQRYLTTNNSKFHTLTLLGERVLKVLTKGLSDIIKYSIQRYLKYLEYFFIY